MRVGLPLSTLRTIVPVLLVLHSSTAAAAVPATGVPGVVVIEGLQPPSVLGDAILAALAACSDPAADPRISGDGAVRRIAIGGSGPDWTLHVDALRTTPAHKAALWRVLRTLRRGRRQ